MLAPPPSVDPLAADPPGGLARMIAARDDRLRVAKRRRGEIVNEYRGRRWDGCTLPALPFAVYLASGDSYRTLAFDLDASRGDVTTDAAALRRLLHEAGIGFIETISGPSGGRHLIATFPAGLPAPEVAALAKHLARTHVRSVDPSPLCNPATGSLRPPGSPHRHGGTSVLITPPSAAVAVLAVGNDRKAFDRLCAVAGLHARTATRRQPPAARTRRPLSPQVARLLREGDVDGRWADRSPCAAAVCLGFIEAGHTFSDLLRAARDRCNRGLDHLRRVRIGPGRYRQRSRSELTAACRRMWRGRIRYAEQRPATPSAAGELDAHIAVVLAAAEASPARWAGQAGPSDLAALRAVAHLVAIRRAPVVSAGTRTISELTGRTQSTADRALRRLTRDGWLIRVSAGQGTDAATYRIATPQKQPTQSSSTPAVDAPVVGGSLTPAPPTTERLRTAIAIQAHDVMTNDGLGRYAAAVHIALSIQPGTVAEFAARTGLTSRTVRRQLRRLAAAGLALRTGPVWAATDLAALKRAADQFRVTGTVARRAAAHAAERATWRWYLADFAARRSFTVQRGQWLPGRHALITGDRHVPSRPFPRRAGRATHAHALRLVLDGQGPTDDSVARTLAPPPSPVTTSVDRCTAPRRHHRPAPPPSTTPISPARRHPRRTSAALTSVTPASRRMRLGARS